jgi:hypothetical protein
VKGLFAGAPPPFDFKLCIDTSRDDVSDIVAIAVVGEIDDKDSVLLVSPVPPEAKLEIVEAELGGDPKLLFPEPTSIAALTDAVRLDPDLVRRSPGPVAVLAPDGRAPFFVRIASCCCSSSLTCCGVMRK